MGCLCEVFLRVVREFRAAGGSPPDPSVFGRGPPPTPIGGGFWFCAAAREIALECGEDTVRSNRLRVQTLHRQVAVLAPKKHGLAAERAAMAELMVQVQVEVEAETSKPFNVVIRNFVTRAEHESTDLQGQPIPRPDWAWRRAQAGPGQARTRVSPSRAAIRAAICTWIALVTTPRKPTSTASTTSIGMAWTGGRPMAPRPRTMWPRKGGRVATAVNTSPQRIGPIRA